jgi:hypothetical protein
MFTIQVNTMVSHILDNIRPNRYHCIYFSILLVLSRALSNYNTVQEHVL